MKQLKTCDHKYNCIMCNYFTNSKKDYNRHLKTSKHMGRNGETKKAQIIIYVKNATNVLKVALHYGDIKKDVLVER